MEFVLRMTVSNEAKNICVLFIFISIQGFSLMFNRAYASETFRILKFRIFSEVLILKKAITLPHSKMFSPTLRWNRIEKVKDSTLLVFVKAEF